MLKYKCMARTLTAPEALAYYFKHRPAFVENICYHVAAAKRNWGTDRKFHAEYAMDAMEEPARLADFLLKNLHTLAVDSSVKPALEADITAMREYRILMLDFLANPWA